MLVIVGLQVVGHVGVDHVAVPVFVLVPVDVLALVTAAHGSPELSLTGWR